MHRSSSSNFLLSKKFHTWNQIARRISDKKLNNKSFIYFDCRNNLPGYKQFLGYLSKIPFNFSGKIIIINSVLPGQSWSRSCFVSNKITSPTNLKSVRIMLETWYFTWKQRKTFTLKKNQYWKNQNLLMPAFVLLLWWFPLKLLTSKQWQKSCVKGFWRYCWIFYKITIIFSL